jgi:hypothetical protein
MIFAATGSRANGSSGLEAELPMLEGLRLRELIQRSHRLCSRTAFAFAMQSLISRLQAFLNGCI